MNLVEGAQDKTESGLRAILFSQAKLRLIVALPVIVTDLILYLLAPGGVPVWFLGLTAGYCAYALTPCWLIPRGHRRALERLLLATAILDPLVLSVWIALTDVYGALIAGFYLFTTLGFGFRTGRPLMHICQITSIIGFSAVLAVDEYWQQNSVIWMAVVVPLIVVPMYAGILIRNLRKSREHAEEQSRAKSELLAKVSHELRTPLTGIVASAELLAVEAADDTVARRTKTILALSDNLLCEINDLLDQAKFEAQSVALHCVPVNLAEQIIGLRATFETMTARKGLVFLDELDASIVDCVEVDRHYLDRILLNLASNAIKFTETGSVRLAVELLEQSVTDYRIRFSIVDTGIGIPEAFRTKIFEPFAQVEQGANRRYGGTGLGLALSRRIIAAMGGELQFESTLGSGSRFWFDLQLRRSAPGAAPAPTEIAPIVCGKRILVADDNVSNLMLLEEMLSIDRHEVATCSSGAEALDLLVKREFDLLLLDYNLGDMDGVRVLQTYRFGRLHPAPALFLTADATLATATRLREAGGVGILYKPVTLAGIRDALSKVDWPAVAASASNERSREEAKQARPTLTVVPNNPLNEAVIRDLRKINMQPDFLLRLLTQAEKDIAHTCDQVLDALGDRDYAAIRSAAHALKGVSANVGAIRLVTLTSSLMNMSSDEVAQAGDRLAADIRESARATSLALKKIASDDAAAVSVKDTGALQSD
jgi:two-component system sensor histidine kinase RpfC